MKSFDGLVADVGTIDRGANTAAGRSVDRVLTLRNWLIGACIIEYEQNGEDRGTYGDRLIPELARRLKEEGLKGHSVTNLKNFRQITLAWPGLEILQTVSAILDRDDGIRQTASGESEQTSLVPFNILNTEELSFPSLAERAKENPPLEWQDQAWFERLFSSLSFSKLLELSRIDDPLKRAFYELECMRSGWSVRDLKRQMDSMLYERIGLSKDKDAVMAMAEEGKLTDSPTTIVRDPYVLEFLGLKEQSAWSESDLEQALLDNLQRFIHELGHDFCFVDRQMRITVGSRHHYVDLVFFHRTLKALIAIDLKLGAFKHEYAGQMNFYLSYLAENMTHDDESPPVGIVLCADKDVAEVHYATSGLAHDLFVSRYLVQLPSEDQLTKWLEEERALLEEGKR